MTRISPKSVRSNTKKSTVYRNSKAELKALIAAKLSKKSGRWQVRDTNGLILSGHLTRAEARDAASGWKARGMVAKVYDTTSV